MKIRWENKYSKDTGYVKKLNHKGGYFENTCSEEEAMEISDRQDIIDKTIALLNEWSSQNIYTLVPTEKKAEPEKEKKSPEKEEETTEFILEVEAEEDVPAPKKEEKKDSIPSAEKVKAKNFKAKTKAV